MNGEGDIQRQLQLKIVDILVEIDRICKKHDIKYYLAYGTAIGAVRHNGFIPWDDDADIHMFKEDYEKFAEVCKSELGDKFFLQNEQTDKGYKMYLPKVRMNNTAFVESFTKDWDIHHGIYVDIFILDECPKSDLLKKLNVQIRRTTEFSKKGRSAYKLYKKIIQNMMDPIFKNNRVLNLWEKTIFKYCKKDDEFCMDVNDFGNVLPLKVFGVPKNMMFEGYEFSVPEKVEEYLTYYYVIL